jgi:hypothetical protein
MAQHTKYPDLIGQKFGRLTVLEYDHTDNHCRAYWKCQCDCGNIIITSGTALRSGGSKSCRCLSKEITKKRQVIDLTGKRFEKLLVIEQAEGPREIKNHSRYWLCKCDCGGIIITNGASLRNGSTKSCGCLVKEVITKSYSESSFNTLYNRYKNAAKQRSISFELSKDEFSKITSQNCHYCGIKPMQITVLSSPHNGDYFHNGIDRLDNNKGYTIENSVPCCKNCNYGKGRLTKDEFLSWIEKVYLFNFT